MTLWRVPAVSTYLSASGLSHALARQAQANGIANLILPLQGPPYIRRPMVAPYVAPMPEKDETVSTPCVMLTG